MDKKVILSIVIPTKNRAELLRKVLKSIENQKGNTDHFEVIVIDNGSTDQTKQVVWEYHKKSNRYRYIFDSRPGLHVGRNRGLLESKGDLVGYLDDDVILFPNWITTVLDAFKDSDVAYVGGSVVPYDMSLLSSQFRADHEIRKGSYRYIYPISCFWEEGISENDKRVHESPNGSFFGGNSVYRKEVLQKCRGFHPDGMPKKLQMYRGDGETYVAKYICTHKLKAMYYAQASVYHMIDVNRVSDSYINFMYFRNGISNMYTFLRENGVKGGVLYIQEAVSECVYIGKVNPEFWGKLYLLIYYILYKRVRIWVHKEEYF